MGAETFFTRFSQEDIFRNFDIGAILEEFGFGQDFFSAFFNDKTTPGKPFSFPSDFNFGSLFDPIPDEAETSFDIQKLQTEAQLKEQLMQVEFEMQMQLKGVEQENILSRESNREKAKKERINQQSTNTSKIAEQKKRNLTSINFESNEDSLDGFDFAEFNPR